MPTRNRNRVFVIAPIGHTEVELLDSFFRHANLIVGVPFFAVSNDQSTKNYSDPDSSP